MKHPSLFFQDLRKQGYKLKGVREITYHLGGDFFRNPNGTLKWGEPKPTSSKCIVNQCPSIFGGLPKKWMSLIDKDDHPELDTTEELPIEGI
jgi:hypothetical protein